MSRSSFTKSHYRLIRSALETKVVSCPSGEFNIRLDIGTIHIKYTTKTYHDETKIIYTTDLVGDEPKSSGGEFES